MNSSFRLIRKIFQILLHQRAIFLRIFFRLRLLNGRAIALGQTDERAIARGCPACAVRSTRTAPVSVFASAARRRRAFPLPGLLAFARGLSLPRRFPLSLSLLSL